MQYARERTGRLAAMLVDSRKRTLELVGDLSDESMIGPQLRIVNPPQWDIGHLAWFQERWNLRRIMDEDLAQLRPTRTARPLRGFSDVRPRLGGAR